MVYFRAQVENAPSRFRIGTHQFNSGTKLLGPPYRAFQSSPTLTCAAVCRCLLCARRSIIDIYMSTAIIIRGPAGVGKSTVSRLLASRLGARHISFDRIRRRRRLKVSESDRIKANAIAVAIARKDLTNSRIVIFDDVFYYRSQLRHLRHLVRSLHRPHRTFTLKAPLPVCIQRDHARPYHRRIGANRVREVYRLVSRFNSGVLVNTSAQSPRQTARRILMRLRRTQSAEPSSFSPSAKS